MVLFRMRTGVVLAILPLVAGCLVQRLPNPRYGALWNWSYHPEWERFVGQQDGLRSFQSNPRTSGLELFSEWRSNSPWSVGISGQHNRHRVNQIYEIGLGSQSETSATINGWYFGPFLARNLKPTEWADVQLKGGPVIKVNTGVFKFLDALGLLYDQEQRTHVGTAWQFGTSVNLGVGSNWGITASYEFSDSFQPDADNKRTASVGMYFDHVRIARKAQAPRVAARRPE